MEVDGPSGPAPASASDAEPRREGQLVGPSEGRVMCPNKHAMRTITIFCLTKDEKTGTCDQCRQPLPQGTCIWECQKCFYWWCGALGCNQATAEQEAKQKWIRRIEQLEGEMRELKEGKGKLEAELTARTQAQFLKGANAVWEYQADKKWHSFGVDASEQLHLAYVRFLCHEGPQVVHVESGGQERQIDLKDRVQVNVRTGARRGVRLNLIIPTSWQHPVSKLVVQEPQTLRVLELRKDILMAIKELMCSAAHKASAARTDSRCLAMGNLRVERVWRIENFALWCRYRDKAGELLSGLAREQREPKEVSPCIGLLQPEMQKRLGSVTGNFTMPAALNERWMFHGTSRSNAEKICQFGFDHRVSAAGTYYGQGTYFASESCKSHQYTSDTCQGSRGKVPRSMLLARVLIADAYYTKELYEGRRPPQREDGKGLYHTVVANPGPMRGHSRQHQDHQEFVIFDSSQAYPAYWVEYTTT